MDGHAQLIKDLKLLLLQVENREFHDFSNANYAMPKVELVKRLDKLIQNTKNGQYDN